MGCILSQSAPVASAEEEKEYPNSYLPPFNSVSTAPSLSLPQYTASSRPPSTVGELITDRRICVLICKEEIDANELRVVYEGSGWEVVEVESSDLKFILRELSKYTPRSFVLHMVSSYEILGNLKEEVEGGEELKNGVAEGGVYEEQEEAEGRDKGEIIALEGAITFQEVLALLRTISCDNKIMYLDLIEQFAEEKESENNDNRNCSNYKLLGANLTGFDQFLWLCQQQMQKNEVSGVVDLDSARISSQITKINSSVFTFAFTSILHSRVRSCTFQSFAAQLKSQVSHLHLHFDRKLSRTFSFICERERNLQVPLLSFASTPPPSSPLFPSVSPSALPPDVCYCSKYELYQLLPRTVHPSESFILIRVRDHADLGIEVGVTNLQCKFVVDLLYSVNELVILQQLVRSGLGVSILAQTNVWSKQALLQVLGDSLRTSSGSKRLGVVFLNYTEAQEDVARNILRSLYDEFGSVLCLIQSWEVENIGVSFPNAIIYEIIEEDSDVVVDVAQKVLGSVEVVETKALVEIAGDSVEAAYTIRRVFAGLTRNESQEVARRIGEAKDFKQFLSLLQTVITDYDFDGLLSACCSFATSKWTRDGTVVSAFEDGRERSYLRGVVGTADVLNVIGSELEMILSDEDGEISRAEFEEKREKVDGMLRMFLNLPAKCSSRDEVQLVSIMTNGIGVLAFDLVQYYDSDLVLDVIRKLEQLTTVQLLDEDPAVIEDVVCFLEVVVEYIDIRNVFGTMLELLQTCLKHSKISDIAFGRSEILKARLYVENKTHLRESWKMVKEVSIRSLSLLGVDSEHSVHCMRIIAKLHLLRNHPQRAYHVLSQCLKVTMSLPLNLIRLCWELLKIHLVEEDTSYPLEVMDDIMMMEVHSRIQAYEKAKFCFEYAKWLTAGASEEVAEEENKGEEDVQKEADVIGNGISGNEAVGKSKVETAIDALEISIREFEVVCGVGSKEVVECIVLMGDLLYQNKEYDFAADVFREVLTLRSELSCGKNEKEIAFDRLRYAHTLMRQEKYVEAAGELQKCGGVFIRLHGVEDSAVAECLGDLGVSLVSTEKYEVAQRVLLKSFALLLSLLRRENETRAVAAIPPVLYALLVACRRSKNYQETIQSLETLQIQLNELNSIVRQQMDSVEVSVQYEL